MLGAEGIAGARRRANEERLGEEEEWTDAFEPTIRKLVTIPKIPIFSKVCERICQRLLATTDASDGCQ